MFWCVFDHQAPLTRRVEAVVAACWTSTSQRKRGMDYMYPEVSGGGEIRFAFLHFAPPVNPSTSLLFALRSSRGRRRPPGPSERRQMIKHTS